MAYLSATDYTRAHPTYRMPPHLGGAGNPKRRALVDELLDREPRRYISISGEPLDTFRRIAGIIERYRMDPLLIEALRQYGLDALRNVPDRGYARDGRKAYAREIEAIWTWALEAFRYTQDPYMVEWVYTPAQMLGKLEYEGAIAADCDDFVVLLALMFLAHGKAVQLAMVGHPGAKRYTHIYVRVSPDGGRSWIPFDATNRRAGIGWEMPHGKIHTYTFGVPKAAA